MLPLCYTNMNAFNVIFLCLHATCHMYTTENCVESMYQLPEVQERFAESCHQVYW